MNKITLPFEDYENSNFAKFNDGLNKIESDNLDFFKSRPGKFENQEHDLLSNHLVSVEYETGKIGYLPHPDSDLPQNIIDQVIALHRSLTQPLP